MCPDEPQLHFIVVLYKLHNENKSRYMANAPRDWHLLCLNRVSGLLNTQAFSCSLENMRSFWVCKVAAYIVVLIVPIPGQNILIYSNFKRTYC